MSKTSQELNIEWRHPESITPYHLNSKKHPTEQIDKIAASIAAFKFDQPIVVDEDGIILKGHGRREAALRLGLESVPVIVRRDLSEIEKKAARIADNKVSESPHDMGNLALELQALNEAGFDSLLTGFSEDEMKAILGGDSAKSLDELEDEYGDHDESTFWPKLIFQVPPDVEDRWKVLSSKISGSDWEKFEKILQAVDPAALATNEEFA